MRLAELAASNKIHGIYNYRVECGAYLFGRHGQLSRLRNRSVPRLTKPGRDCCEVRNLRRLQNCQGL